MRRCVSYLGSRGFLRGGQSVFVDFVAERIVQCALRGREMEKIVRFSSLLTGLALVLACGLAPNDTVAQDAPAVENVLFVDVAGDFPKFLEFYARFRAIGEKYGSTGTGRVWVATLAGPNTGNVVVVTEYPSFVSMAESNAKTFQTPEWQQAVADFQAAGMSLISNQVIVEATP